MKNILTKIIGAIILLALLGFGVYYFLMQGAQNTIFGNNETEDSQSVIEYRENNNELSLVIDGQSQQTLSLDTDAIESLSIAPNAKKFITDLDMNFDGQNDVGVFQSTGYAGVNNYYDFYIYNSETQRLEKNEKLNQISNPTINVEEKEITSVYKTGPYWDEQVYQYKNNNFTKKPKEEIVVATNGTYEYAQDDKWLLIRDAYLFEGERSAGNLVIFDKVNRKVKAQIQNILSFTIDFANDPELQKTLDVYRSQDENNILISEYYDFEPSQNGGRDNSIVPNQQKLNALEEQLGIDLEEQIHGFGGKPTLGVGVLYILNLNTLEKTYVGIGGYDGLLNVKVYISTNSIIVTEKDTKDPFERWEIKRGSGLQYKLVY